MQVSTHSNLQLVRDLTIISHHIYSAVRDAREATATVPVDISNIHSHGMDLELVKFHEITRTQQVPKKTVQSPCK